MRARQVHLRPVGLCRVCRVQQSLLHADLRELAAREIGLRQARTPEVAVLHDDSGQVAATQVGSRHPDMVEVAVRQVLPGQVGSGKIGVCQPSFATQKFQRVVGSHRVLPAVLRGNARIARLFADSCLFIKLNRPLAQ